MLVNKSQVFTLQNTICAIKFQPKVFDSVPALAASCRSYQNPTLTQTNASKSNIHIGCVCC